MSDKRTLIVTGLKPIANIKNKSGGQSTLYEVYATDANGVIIEEPLRAFTELEENVPLEYTVERYTHPQYGTSYTLTPPRRNTPKRLRELEDQVEKLTMWAVRQGFAQPEWDRELREKREAEKKEQDRIQDAAHEEPAPEEEHEEPPPLPPEAAAVDAGEQQTQQQEPTPAPDRPDLDEKYGEEAPWNEDDIGPPPSEEPPPPKDLELG